MSSKDVMDKLGEGVSRRQFIKAAAGSAFGFVLSLLGIPQSAEARHACGTSGLTPPCPSGYTPSYCCCLDYSQTCTSNQISSCSNHWCWYCIDQYAYSYECFDCFDAGSLCSKAIFLGYPAAGP